LSLALWTIYYLYETVMVICEIECQLTKESEKLYFISGHVNIMILASEISVAYLYGLCFLVPK
jgi:hypothetical protein